MACFLFFSSQGCAVMTSRTGTRIIHALAGIIAFVTISLFFISTIAVELFGDATAVTRVKAAIVSGLFVLVPALAITGGTGFALSGSNPKGLAAKKLRRMKIIAPNGILVLAPAALFLNWKAGAAEFDLVFFTVQVLELVAGSTNLILLGLNIRDGLRMTGRLGRRQRLASRKS